jgi:hypothetical protein
VARQRQVIDGVGALRRDPPVDERLVGDQRPSVGRLRESCAEGDPQQLVTLAVVQRVHERVEVLRHVDVEEQLVGEDAPAPREVLRRESESDAMDLVAGVVERLQLQGAGARDPVGVHALVRDDDPVLHTRALLERAAVVLERDRENLVVLLDQFVELGGQALLEGDERTRKVEA